jgi:subtilisin family serine protease
MSAKPSWAEGIEGSLEQPDFDEIDYIIEAFAEAEEEDRVKIAVADNGAEGVYLYAEGQILALSEYLWDVLSVLLEDGWPEDYPQNRSSVVDRGPLLRLRGIRIEPVIEGVDLLYLGDIGLSVPAALARVDEALGEGIATPDQVLTVAGGDVGPCPATEPQEVHGDVGPYPSLCQGGDCSKVKIYVADTGWVAPAAGITWLSGVDGEADPNTPLAVGAGQMAPIKPYAGHGTFVAGVVRSMAPQADIWVENIFRIAGSQLESRAARKLRTALNGPEWYDIFHVSVAASTRKTLHLIAIEKWLALLHWRKGRVCVVPAGNFNSTSPHWPGASPRAVSVGALDLDWRSLAYFTDHGPWVDVYAPGTNLVNAYLTGKYECHVDPYKSLWRRFFGRAQWSGTSFSSPIVTGLIASRMTCTGESAAQAAADLLAMARAQSIPGTGPILLPCCGDDPTCGGPGECCGRCRRGPGNC